MKISRRFRFWTLLTLAAQLLSPSCYATQLKPEANAAFDRFIALNQSRLRARVTSESSFLAIDTWAGADRAKAYADLKGGKVLIRNHLAGKDASVPGGLIHDWLAVVFIPGATLQNALAVLQDYDQDAVYYHPDVAKSQLLSHAGNDFHIFLRLKRTYVITAVFDTEYDVHYTLLGSSHADSEALSTRVTEVRDTDPSQGSAQAKADDRGLLWRLNSYWRFYEADGGTYVQCEAISLTRDIPAGLGWLVRPFVEKVPMESLRFTMSATRNAVLKFARRN